MKSCRLATILWVSAALAGAQTLQESSIGGAYPGGIPAGQTTRVIIQGQSLFGAEGVHVSGANATAKGVTVYTAMRRLNGDQMKELFRQIRDRRVELLGPKGGQPRPNEPFIPPDKPAKANPPPAPETTTANGDTMSGNNTASANPASGKQSKKSNKDDLPANARLPKHPWLEDIGNMSVADIENLVALLQQLRADKQLNAQLAQPVGFDLTIPPGTPPGPIEVRLRTPRGLTNPLTLHVGNLPEILELEPNDPGHPNPNPGITPVTLPAILNGQIMTGDIDSFTFDAQKGQQLVFRVHARDLNPFLADAVPGWFQAVLIIKDNTGRQVAFADDYRFSPDPLLIFPVPADGTYRLEIRDALFRGRSDFVYRIEAGEFPFISSMFPAGGKTGDPLKIAISGVNLPLHYLNLDASPGPDPVRTARLPAPLALASPPRYTVDDLPLHVESQDPGAPQPVKLPLVVHGRIQYPGDADLFQFHLEAGATIVAEVQARSLGSALDSLITLTDAAGKTVVLNDDLTEWEGHLHTQGGRDTHAADSYLMTTVERAGEYTLRITDAGGQGTPETFYRLRLSPPRPDFQVRANPSAINVRPGSTAAVYFHARRLDGFNGTITIQMPPDLKDYRLSGATLPAGVNSISATLTAPASAKGRTASFEFQAVAPIGNQTVTRTCLPADDVMQAFLYRHLQPAREQMLFTGFSFLKYFSPQIPPETTARLTANQTTTFSIPVQGVPDAPSRIDLRSPPPGITLSNSTCQGGKWELAIACDAKAPPQGNLIVEAYFPVNTKGFGNKKNPLSGKLISEVLPAIPYQISP